MKLTLTPSRNPERATTTRPMFTSGSGVANRLEGREENMANTLKAVKRIINSVWTLKYRPVSETEIEIVHYSRDDDDGYKREHELPKGQPIENGERTIIGASIGGRHFTVKNQAHVFSYMKEAA